MYWRRVHNYAFTATNGWFSLHRGKVFVTALLGAIGLALAIWKLEMDKVTTTFWTFVIWAGAWLFVYLCHLVTAPAKFDADRAQKIDALQEEISKRGARRASADKLKALYERALVLGWGFKQWDDYPSWKQKYEQWKQDVEGALKPISETEAWMFKTIGDTNLISGTPEQDDQAGLLLKELRGRREKLRKIISRLLPPDDPLYEVLSREEP